MSRWFLCHKRRARHVATSSEPEKPHVFPPVTYSSLYRKMTLIPFLRRDEPSSSDSPYNYIPTKWICILFIGLFSCTSLVHIAQAVRYR